MLIALRNIFRNKLRNLLTAMGVAAGIAIFVSCLAVSGGFKSQMQDLIKNYSVDVVVQSKGASSPVQSRISTAEYEKLKKADGIREVSSLVTGSIQTSWNPYFFVVGISSVEALANKFTLVAGRPLTPGRREALVGEGAAKQRNLAVGEELVLSDDGKFTISGIFTVGSRMIDGAAVLDIQDAKRLLKRDDYVNMVFISTERAADPQKVIQSINSDLPGLAATRSGDFLGQLRLFHAIDLFVWVVSAIALFTCCVVVVNTLMMAVSERTKEIGILRAIGWSRGMIFRILLTEAVIISLAGGILGNVAAPVLLRLAGLSSALGYGWLPLYAPLPIVLESLGLSVLLGFVSSLYPVMFALRLLPANAFRYE